MNPEQSTAKQEHNGAKGCALLLLGLILLFVLGTAILLAWPYISGHTHRYHVPAISHSETPLLPPPEQSDEGSR